MRSTLLRTCFKSIQNNNVNSFRAGYGNRVAGLSRRAAERGNRLSTMATDRPLYTDDTFPKVELHVHLEGSVRSTTAWELSQERGISIGATSLEDVVKQMVGWETGDLVTFLNLFSEFMPAVVGSVDVAQRITYELLEDLSRKGVVYAEVRYCPHLLANAPGIERVFRGPEGTITPRDIIRAVNEGIRQGEKDFGIQARSILCMLRERPEWSADLLALCKEFRNDTVVGIDLANDESVQLYEEHIQAYKGAFDAGIHRTCHAAEMGPARNVRIAVEELKAERIGHGYNIVDDEDVFKLVKDKSIHLEVCPSSSLRTGAVKDFKNHPLKRFLGEGLNISLNTDDPTLFGTCMSTEFGIARKHFGMDDKALAKMTVNAAKSSFLPVEEKNQLLNRLHESFKDILDS